MTPSKPDWLFQLARFRISTWRSMIPEEKSGSVAQALREAFGTTDYEALERETKGLSSDLVFRIAVRGAAYSLRVLTHINEQSDPRRQFACLKLAYDAGLAARVR